jgi:hypothetical protein
MITHELINFEFNDMYKYYNILIYLNHIFKTNDVIINMDEHQIEHFSVRVDL